MKNNLKTQSKLHFEILDGLRGVTAIMIVIFHLFETYSKGPEYQIINHGYLGVDFFFLLSGFVTSYAYDDRQISFSNFIKRRLIRLHPFLIFGNIFGLLTFYFGDDYVRFPLVLKNSVKKIFTVFLVTNILIPVPPQYDMRGDQENYPLNSTYWTIIFEYLMNVLHFFILKKLNTFFIFLLTIISGGLLISLTLNLDPFKLFTVVKNPCAFTVIGGWIVNWEHVYIGFCRLLFPFFCGMLISRRKKFIKMKYGFFWSSLLLIIGLSIPRMGKTWTNGVYESVIIMIIFPIIIKIGAGSKINFPFFLKICKFLGDISYPIYATHNPLIMMQMSWATRNQDLELSKHVFVAGCVFVLAMMTAYSSLKIYDEPVRKYLSDKYLRNEKNDEKERKESKDKDKCVDNGNNNDNDLIEKLNN